MGRGNWIPDETRNIDYRMVYVDVFEDLYESLEDGADPALEGQMRYDDFVSEVRDALPASFSKDDRWRGRDGFVAASNGLIDVVIADNQWSLAIALIPKHEPGEGCYNLAVRHLDLFADKVFKELSLQWNIFIRNGAWMSSPYKPPEQNQHAA